MGAQVRALQNGVDVLVATPGRLLDLVTSNALRLGEVEFLVLDEADRMLDMGFIHDIRKIVGSFLRNGKRCCFPQRCRAPSPSSLLTCCVIRPRSP